MLRNVILISGKKSVGKDTVADYLTSFPSTIKIGFAEALKDTLRSLFDIDITNHEGEALSRDLREKIQFFGTDACRRVDADVWCKKVVTRLEDILRHGVVRTVVIKDTRFPNEIEYVKTWGLSRGIKVTSIRLNRSGDGGHKLLDHSIILSPKPSPITLSDVSSINIDYTDSHISEVALDNYKDFDYVLTRTPSTTPEMTFAFINTILDNELRE